MREKRVRRPRRWEDEQEEGVVESLDVRVGEPTVLDAPTRSAVPTRELTMAVCGLIRLGHSLRAASRRYGISESRLKEWYQKSYERGSTLYEEFRLGVEEARSESEMELVGVLMKSALGTLPPLRTMVRGESGGESYEEERLVDRPVDAGTARWLLSKLHSEGYGDRVDVVHSGEVKQIVITDGGGWADVTALVTDVEEPKGG